LSSHHFHGVVDLVQSMCVRSLVLEALEQFKFNGDDFGSLHWSLGASASRLPNCHQQCQDDSGKGAATSARRRLALAVVVVLGGPRTSM
jgi:hypothetical protein